MAVDKPLSAEDLYAPSAPAARSETPPLKYEETPIIDPLPGPSETPPPIPPRQPERRVEERPSAGILVPIVLFILLFIVGFAVSGVVRNFLSTRNLGSVKLPSIQKNPTAAPTTSPGATTGTSGTATPSAQQNLKTFAILSGTTRQPIPGLTVQLPADVLTPTCDSSGCPSQGSYLPGGTRLTLAPRGKGQVLPNFQNRIISDTAGKAFTLSETTLGGRKAIEFTGTFTGNTVSGYSFSQMHGYMIELSPDLSLEINHFVPAGLKADFSADDALFEKVAATVSNTTPGEKGAIVPTPTK